MSPSKAERNDQTSNDLSDLFETVANKMSRFPAMREVFQSITSEAQDGSNKEPGTDAISAKAREQIAIAVAAANGSPYCLQTHIKLGREAGVTEPDLIAARNGLASDPRTQLILHLALEINKSFNGGSVNLREATWKTDLSQAEILAIMVFVATNVLANCLNKRRFSRTDLAL